MKVIELKFENYRNLKNSEIIPSETINIIYGDNAQGKTNLLEALWLFCGGHSFRTTKDGELVNWDNEVATLEMRFWGQDREQTAKIKIENGKRNVEINGIPQKSAASLIEKYCAVVFYPEHLNLIKRGPSERRKFVDGAICKEKLQNAVILAKFNRILMQRNAMLKDITKHPQLEESLVIWDEPLIKYGSLLIKNRIDYVKMLTKSAAEYHRGISQNQEVLKIMYLSSIGANSTDSLQSIEKKYKEKVRASHFDDIKNGVTTFGPHRDDIGILINNKLARNFASQGQQRSAVLSLKLAEAAVLKEKMGEEPIILLDDVLSELDPGRQMFLLNELKNCQVFITCCDRLYRDEEETDKMIYVEEGILY
jgi:DNA replication and repair protein RecF